MNPMKSHNSTQEPRNTGTKEPSIYPAPWQAIFETMEASQASIRESIIKTHGKFPVELHDYKNQEPETLDVDSFLPSESDIMEKGDSPIVIKGRRLA